MPPPPPQLPILARRDEIIAAVRSHRVVVICGETGSGKTTQLPQICLDMGLADGKGIIGHTQPRRLAARAVAARIAEERSEKLGGLVGVKVRFQDSTSRATKIKVMTDGMLLAELSSDPDLRQYSTIIIDEAHERSLNIDFLLGYFRALLPKRQDLKLIITSATIDPGRFSDYFGGRAVAPVIEVSGRGYPVGMKYRPHREEDEQSDKVEVEAVADAVEDVLSPHVAGVPGDVLVFLPGEREIRLAGDALRRRRLDADVLPLMSRLTNEEQDRIFHPGSRRRVILATNVAETSLTVPGIVYVVDTGLARLSRYDPAKKIQRLPIEPISRASANQRSGRCGRIAPGICVRLYSEDSYAARAAFTDPEIRRTNLASVILQMKALRLGAIEDFPFLDPPDKAAVADGYETLFELGAIESASREGKITPIGEQMSRVPTDPRIARMLLGAEREGALRETVVLAAVLSIQDPRDRPLSRQADADRAHAVFRDESSDFLTLLKLWDQSRHARDNMNGGEYFTWCREQFVSPARLREWAEMARQLAEVCEDLELKFNERPATNDQIHRALLTGLITNVACREGDGSFDYRGVRGNVVQIFPGSVLFKKGPKWIMAAEVVQTTRLYARTLARVDPDWVEELAGHMFRRQFSDPHLDPDSGQPSAWERLSMSGIVVVPRRRADLAPFDRPAARRIFIKEGLAACAWKTDAPFMAHNRHILAGAQTVEAKLRRRGVAKATDDLATWFESRIPPAISDPQAFDKWRTDAEAKNPRLLMLDIADVVRPDAAPGLDATLFPNEIEIGTGADTDLCEVSYALSPGKDEDGVTITIGLRSLPLLTADRAAWCVPGVLPDIISGLVKLLPKTQRTALESKADASSIGAAAAEVMSFAQGSLLTALSEAVKVLYNVNIPPETWQIQGLPAHLRPRIRVIDDESNKELGADRDVEALLKKFQSRLKQARAADQRSTFDRHNLTTWDFPDLPDLSLPNSPAPFTTLDDAGTSISLTLAQTREQAAIRTRLGLRRLFALACKDEVVYYLDSHPAWSEMTRQFAQLGTPEELRDQVTCVIAERVFMDNQPALRTKSAYDERLVACWGRLSAISREVCDALARVLEARAQIARRFSGGTPRLWAESVADIREQAAYLMPRGFIAAVAWDRLRRYPVYAEVMRERLLNLREDGSKSESAALAALAPHWKRFTGWVAQEMAAERTRQDTEGPTESPTDGSAGGRKTKAPLPQARRAAPTVNVDAGEWAMRPARLGPGMDRYRWGLEELRVALFAPERAARPAMTSADLERLWPAGIRS